MNHAPVSWLILALALSPMTHAAIDVKTDLVSLGIAETNLMGDGATDDAPALQALAKYLAGRGGKVVFPPGRYVLNSTVRFRQVAGHALELIGENAVIVGSAQQFLDFSSAVAVRQALTKPTGAFDTVLHVPDPTAFAVGDLVGVWSRRSSEPPANLKSDNSGGVEHLAHVAAVDHEAGTITLTAKLPWHQKATNNLFKNLSKYDYYRLTVRGFRFEMAAPEAQTAARFNTMRDVTLKDMEVRYLGDNQHPTGNGFLFQGVHSLYCENVDFHRVMYCLWQVAGNSDHTYVGCDGYRTRHTFVLSDSTNTIIRDSHGYGCVSHLDTHRGVNHVLIQGCRSDHDQGAYRNVAAVSMIRDSIFTGFGDGGVSISGAGERVQSETYVLAIVGEGLGAIAIDDVLEFGESMTAAVVSIMERGERSITVIAYQLLGKGYDEGGPKTDLGSRFSGGGWPVTVEGKDTISGKVVFHDYVQTHLGRSVIDNCYFDASSSAGPAITIGARFAAEIRNTTIVNPDIGIAVGGAAIFWNDSIRIENVRILQPRGAAFRLANWQGIDLVNCEVIGAGRRGVGIVSQDGAGSVARLVDCRFSGLETALDFKGTLHATRVSIAGSGTGLVLHGGGDYRLRDFHNTADIPVQRVNFRGRLDAMPRLDDPSDVFARVGAAHFDPQAKRLLFRAGEGWRDEAGAPTAPATDE